MLLCIQPIFKIGMVALLVLTPCSACIRFCKSSLLMGDIRAQNLQKASAKILPHLQIEIVKRSDQAKGFLSFCRDVGLSNVLSLGSIAAVA